MKKRVFLSLASGFFLLHCYLDNPERATPAPVDASAPSPPIADAGADVVIGPDGAVVPPEPVDAGSLCLKYGGYATVEVVVNHLLGTLVADCRISPYFTTLTSERVGHVRDCLVKQVAVVMRCPGVRYDVDNAGVECRDMKSSHKGLAIRQADFDALVQDLVMVLQTDGVAAADIDALAPSLLALRDDIVTNSAPGHNRTICDSGDK